jgi:hypothetical protein
MSAAMKLNVVHIDDDENDRKMVQEALSHPGENGIEVEPLPDYKALSLYNPGPEHPVSLAIVDLHFGKRRIGQQIVHYLEKQFPDTYVVVLTHYPDDGNELRTSPRVVGVLDKSKVLTTPAQLRKALREALESCEFPIGEFIEGEEPASRPEAPGPAAGPSQSDVLKSVAGMVLTADENAVRTEAWDEYAGRPQAEKLVFPRRLFEKLEPLKPGALFRYRVAWEYEETRGWGIRSGVERVEGKLHYPKPLTREQERLVADVEKGIKNDGWFKNEE